MAFQYLSYPDIDYLRSLLFLCGKLQYQAQLVWDRLPDINQLLFIS